MSSTIPTPACGYCGAYHTGTCPRVKSIEFHENGAVRRVELHDPNEVLRDPQGWPLLFPRPAGEGDATPPEAAAGSHD